MKGIALKSIGLLFLLSLSVFRIAAQKFSQIEFQQTEISAKEKFGSLQLKEKAILGTEIIPGTIRRSGLPEDATTAEYTIQYDRNGNTITCHALSFDSSTTKTVITISVDENEIFYGCGEQFSHFVLNGNRFPIITEEQGIGRGDKPITKFTKLFGVAGSDVSTYYPVPFAVCKHYSIFLDRSSASFPAVFDFSKKGKIIIEVYAKGASVCIQTGESMRALIEAHPYYAKSENTTLPKWAYGTILGLQGGKNKVDSILDNCLKLGNPVTAIWIQDWCGRRKTRLGSQLKWEWKADTTLYPEIDKWIITLNKKGIKVLGYVNPFLSIGTPMYEEAKSKNYLIKDSKGNVYITPTGGFDAALVNVMDDNASHWLQQIIKTNMIDIGLNGWMADFGEWCPWFVQDSIYNTIVNDSKLNSIQFPARNSYTNKWALLNNDVIESCGRDDLLFFMRSGSALSANSAPMFWMGDQSVNWGKEDGLKSTLTALNSAALSGIAYLHSDIGGYTTVDNAFVKVKRDKDLFFRWAELNVFQPFYRTHEGLKPNSNHQFYSDDSTMRFFAKMGKLHFRLKDYIHQYQERNTIALIHPLLLNFPDDTPCSTITNQFMCGDELMVAPISDKNTFERNVYFPPGKWMHLFTKKIYKGGTLTRVEAPYGVIPVFVKTDSKWVDYFEWLME